MGPAKKMVLEMRKRPPKEKEARESEEDEDFSDDYEDREEETSSIGSASVSEATSRSETPVGTGSSVGNAGASKRGRKGRRKGPHLTGRSPKLQFKCVGYLKEDHGQVNKLFRNKYHLYQYA